MQMTRHRPPEPAEASQPARSSGFTLIELVVVIGIVSVMSAALIPYLIRPQAQARARESVEELGLLQEALLGNPSTGDYGFVGTMGHLPQPDASHGNMLVALVEQGTQPDPGFAGLDGSVHEDGFGNVSIGWNGPYVRKITPNPLLDGWGTPYAIVTHASEPWRYRLVSAGPDRDLLGEDDNITFPSSTSWYIWSAEVILHLQYMGADGHWATMPEDWLDVNSVQFRYPRSGLQCDSLAGDPCDVTCDFTVPGLDYGSCMLVDPLTGAPQRIPFGRHSVQVEMVPTTSQCITGVNCVQVVNVDVLEPQSHVDVRLPNPNPISTPMGNLKCELDGPVTGTTVTPAQLCQPLNPIPPVTVGESDEVLVNLQVSGEWSPAGAGDDCVLRVERVFSVGGTPLNTKTQILARSSITAPPDPGDRSAMAGAFLDQLPDLSLTNGGQGSYQYNLQVLSTSGSCAAQGHSMSGFRFTQHP